MKKYEQMAADIRGRIREMLQGGRRKLPTEQTFGRQYGVSRQTVRAGLHLLEQEGLVTHIQGSGWYLTGLMPLENDNRVALLLTTDTQYIYPQLLRDMEQVLSGAGYRVSVYITHSDIARERNILRSLSTNPPRGLITECCHSMLPNPNLDLFTDLEHLGSRILFLHGVYPNFPEYISVRDDNEKGAYDLTGYLISRGHRNIGGIFQSDTSQSIERYYGYIRALIDAGLPVRENAIGWFTDSDLAGLEDHGRSAFLGSLLDTVLRESTAAVCYNDEIAYWLMEEAARAGIRVPEDLSIAGFDNSYLRHTGTAVLTTLAHDPHQMGTQTASLLIRMMRGDPVQSLRVGWRLVEGGSVR